MPGRYGFSSPELWKAMPLSLCLSSHQMLKKPPDELCPGLLKIMKWKRTSRVRFLSFHFIELRASKTTTTITTVLVMVVRSFLHTRWLVPLVEETGTIDWWGRQRDMPGRYSFFLPGGKAIPSELYYLFVSSPSTRNPPDELYPGLLKIMKWKKTYFKYVFFHFIISENQPRFHHNHNNCPCYGCVISLHKGDWCPLWRKLALVTDEETRDMPGRYSFFLPGGKAIPSDFLHISLSPHRSPVPKPPGWTLRVC